MVPAATDPAADTVRDLDAFAAQKTGDDSLARQRWEALAAAGNTRAMINPANLDEQGQGVAPDVATATADTCAAGEAGDCRAPYDLAMAYAHGAGVPHDLKRAASWLERAGQGAGGHHSGAGQVEAREEPSRLPSNSVQRTASVAAAVLSEGGRLRWQGRIDMTRSRRSSSGDLAAPS